jgi:hypothetical protein
MKPVVGLLFSISFYCPSNPSKLIVIGLAFCPELHFSKFNADYCAGNGGYKSD